MSRPHWRSEKWDARLLGDARQRAVRAKVAAPFRPVRERGLSCENRGSHLSHWRAVVDVFRLAGSFSGLRIVKQRAGGQGSGVGGRGPVAAGGTSGTQRDIRTRPDIDPLSFIVHPFPSDPRSPISNRLRHGFSLTELVVVTIIVAAMIALLLPAIQSARENSRRAQCSRNQQQITKAMLGFE